MVFNFEKCILSITMLFLISSLSEVAGTSTSVNKTFFAVQDSQKKLSAKEIREKLEEAAEQELRNGNGEFDDGAERLLKDAIRGGAVRVFADGSTDNQITEAETSTKKLVKALIENGSKQGNGKVRIVPETFIKAWGICSIYPFC